MALERFDDYLQLMDAIRHRPAMWLGSHSISALQQRMLGVRLAEDFHQIERKDRIVGSGLEHFEQWVENRFNPRRLSLRSYGLARETAGDEAKALDLWFAWLDQFRKSQRDDR